ncbi:MAG: DUF2306 domain-containing protein [Pyrinomonadaceae bacterium]
MVSMITKPAKLTLSVVVILFAVLIAAYAFSYLSFAQTGFLESKNAAVVSNVLWKLGFYAHVGFGGLALAIGGFQFIEPLRNRFISAHRSAGKIYVLSVFIASITSFAIAPFAEAGIVAKIGFAALAAAWFYTNYRAYTAIRRVDILEHRKWMVRNYALTFAAVTLRLWLPLELAVVGLDFPTAYRIVAWLCWVPNLAVAEYLVSRIAGANLVSSQTLS